MTIERLCAVGDVPDGEARRFDLGKTRHRRGANR